MDVLFPEVFAKKLCPKCGQTKTVNDFRKDKGKKDGLYLWCKICHSSYTSAHQKENYDPSKARAKHLMAKYGITEDEYIAIYERQGGVCASCGQKETIFSNKKKDTFQLAVDHDHITGKVRALLCISCNTSLGAMNEDVERIEALLRYARKIKGIAS